MTYQVKSRRKSKVFSRIQHGSTRQRSTYSSILEVQALLEEAEELTTLLFISSFDFSKAFDSVDPDAIDFSLRRSQTPEPIVQWLRNLDAGSHVMIRTPHCLAEFQRLSTNFALIHHRK